MENIERMIKNQNESHMMVSLNRQIKALQPLRISYQNLQRYYQKIEIDLASLLDQHDYADCSLRSNIQNLSVIALRTQSQRNELASELRERQNDQAKIILDTRNIAQKYQALNQKLQLQANRTQEGISYRTQLQNMLETVKTNILSIENINQRLGDQQAHSDSELKLIKKHTDELVNNKASLEYENKGIKSSIAKLNVKNDDMVDGNRKLQQQIRSKEEQLMARNRSNRQLKQKLIELKSSFQKLKNQIQYRITLLTSENASNTQLKIHAQNMQSLLSDLQSQKSSVCKQNQALNSEIIQMQRLRQENVQFKLNSENHLAQLRQANQFLLSKMQQCCIQDRQVQNLLVRKMSSLQFFAKRINQNYQFEQSTKIQTTYKQSSVFREMQPNLEGIMLLKDKLSRVQSQKSQIKKDTRSSDKAWPNGNSASKTNT